MSATAKTAVIDAHVRVGHSRDVTLTAEQLLESMHASGIDRALIAPPEAAVAFDNRVGNAEVAAVAAASGGRLLPYAVATPWQGAGRAVDELARARDAYTKLTLDNAQRMLRFWQVRPTDAPAKAN